MSLITREVKSMFNVPVALVNTELGNLAGKISFKRKPEMGVIESVRKAVQVSPSEPTDVWPLPAQWSMAG